MTIPITKRELEDVRADASLITNTEVYIPAVLVMKLLTLIDKLLPIARRKGKEYCPFIGGCSDINCSGPVRELLERFDAGIE